MDQQPKIPTLKDSQKPQVKVRGLGIGLTLAERLKQFKKKDLAFILAGLGVLFMAPLAEHFMMAPESSDGSLQAGWGKGGSGSGANGIFGAGGSPYDRTDGMAPGSPTGGGSDVITPLNVRDPSALVMGPGGTQQPPTNSALSATPPVSAPSSRSESDLKDALAASARGVGAAAKRAALPVPKAALGASALRGYGGGGGSSASASLGPISAGNVPNRGTGGDSTGNARASKDYKGVSRGQTSGGKGLDDLKAAAGRQADNMNRGTGAATDLNAAAQTAIPSGGGGGGASPSSGKDDKFGGNQDKGNKNVGESLAFINMKERMQKEMEMEYKKKELNDMGLLWSQMRNEGIKTLMSKGIFEPIAGAMGGCIKNLAEGKACQENAGPKETLWCDGKSTGLSHSKVLDNVTCDSDPKTTGGKKTKIGKTLKICDGGSGTVLGNNCTWQEEPGAGGGAPPGAVDNAGVLAGSGGLNTGEVANLGNMAEVCSKLTSSESKANPDAVTKLIVGLKDEVGQVIGAQKALIGKDVAAADCKAVSVPNGTVNALQAEAIKALAGLGGVETGSLLAEVKIAAKGSDTENLPKADKVGVAIKNAGTALKEVDDYVGKIPSVSDKPLPTEITEGKYSREQAESIAKSIREARVSLGKMVGNFKVVQTGLEHGEAEANQMVDRFESQGTLEKVVEQNKAYGELKQKAPKELKPTTPEAPKDAPKGGTRDRTETAIKTATDDVRVAGEAVTKYVEMKTNKPDDPTLPELKTTAESKLGVAAGSNAGMISEQTGWATNIQDSIKTHESTVQATTAK